MGGPRAAALLASLLVLSTTGAGRAEEPAIVGGEHGDFSRLVLPVASGTPFTLRVEGRSAALVFPGRTLSFDTRHGLDRLGAARVTALDVAATPAGTRVTIMLGCDCVVSATRIGARLLALDIAPAEAPIIPPPPSRAEANAARDAREAGAVATAEAALMRQLRHAAEQGVVEIDLPPGDPDQAALSGHRQVEAQTVLDRDRPTPPAPPSGCLPDASFDFAAGAPRGLDFSGARAQAMAPLLSEFDAADPARLAALIRLYLSAGLGREAGQLMEAFQTPFPERALYSDLASVLQERAPDPAGPLMAPRACPGAHGLWQTLAGRPPEASEKLADAFAALPAEARLRLGPRLISARLGTGAVAEASGFLDLITRAGPADTPELVFAEAELLVAERRPGEALRRFLDVAATDTPLADEALRRAARLTLRVGAPTPDLALDLAIAAHLGRGQPEEADFLALSAETLGESGDLAGALDALERASARLPAAAEDFAATGTRLLATAPENRPAAADWAALVLGHPGLLARDRPSVPGRLAIAARLLALGLPAPARDLAAPLLTGGPVQRAPALIAAEAELRLGHPALARALTSGLEGPDAAALRARAEAGAQAYGAAVETLTRAGEPQAAADYVFPAGDWDRARASQDRAERTLATYMSRAAPAPDATPAEAAFTAPLPSLARPSLAAPRELIANGAGVADFVRGLLGKDAGKPAD